MKNVPMLARRAERDLGPNHYHADTVRWLNGIDHDELIELAEAGLLNAMHYETREKQRLVEMRAVDAAIETRTSAAVRRMTPEEKKEIDDYHDELNRKGKEANARMERERERLRQEERARYQAAMDRAWQGIKDELRREIIIEWTDELMLTEFSLPDGSTRTWGEASMDDHQRRADMLEKTMRGTGETMAKHLKAVEFLQSSGAPCLQDAMAVAA